VITLSARFGGGVFSPSLYLGALLGALFGQLAILLFGETETGAAFYAVVGMGAVSGAVLGAPLSTTLIVFELTASYEASIALLVAVSLATVITQASPKAASSTARSSAMAMT
jgi:CIC family chloride channel protein